MAVDLNKIKGRLSQIQNKTSKKNLGLWKPTGKHVIRIVRNKFSPDNPFVELLFHYNLNNKTYLSPASFGRPDPIVEEAERLKKLGDSNAYKLAKAIEPKMRVYLPILVRGQEHEGVKFWGFGKTVYEEIMSFMVDEDYGDITDFRTGRDITVDFKEKSHENEFGKTSIKVKPDRTPVTTDKEVLLKIDQQKNVIENWTEPSYEELNTAYQEYLNPEGEKTPDVTVDGEEEILPTEEASATQEELSPSSDKSEKTSNDALLDEFDKIFSK